MKFTFNGRYKEYNCEICGKPSNSTVPNAKICGSIKCKNEATKRRTAERRLKNLPVVIPLSKEEFLDFIMLHMKPNTRIELNNLRQRAEKTIELEDTAHKETLNGAVFGAYRKYKDQLIEKNFKPTIFTN